MASTGGAQRVMKNLVTYLIDKNYSVVLVNDFDFGNENSFDIPDKVKRVYLRKDNKGNPIAKNIERIVKLRQLVKKEKPDILLSFLGVRMSSSHPPRLAWCWGFHHKLSWH